MLPAHAGRPNGMRLSVVVLFLEVTHRFFAGDVAVLINSGMTMRQALTFNLMSAATCYVGFALGVLLGETEESSSSYILGLAGGMFLYISLAHLVSACVSTLATSPSPWAGCWAGR